MNTKSIKRIFAVFLSCLLLLSGAPAAWAASGTASGDESLSENLASNEETLLNKEAASGDEDQANKEAASGDEDQANKEAVSGDESLSENQASNEETLLNKEAASGDEDQANKEAASGDENPANKKAASSDENLLNNTADPNVETFPNKYADFLVDDIAYKITDKDALTVEVANRPTFAAGGAHGVGSHYKGAYNIPAQVEKDNVTYTVAGIGANAFTLAANVTAISLPEGIQYIGDNAFSQTKIVSLEIPASVEEIGSSVFLPPLSGAPTLTSITFAPDSCLKTIGFRAFEDCSAVTRLALPESVRTIGGQAFMGSGVTGLVIPAGVDSIDPAAFDGYANGVSVTIDAKNTSYKIQDGAFCSSTTLLRQLDKGIKSVAVPQGVTELGKEVFKGCTALEEVVLPDSLTTIGKGAFSGCTALKEMVIPEGVTELGGGDITGDGVFSGCSSLETVEMPSVTQIGRYAFYQNKTLKAVAMPKVQDIGPDAFNGCSGLRAVELPATLTSVGDSAFSDASSLASVTFADGVASIGDDGFSGCTSLESIVLPHSLTSVGLGAFSGCTALKTVEMPAVTSEIGEYTFYGDTALTSVVMPKVTAIGEAAFGDCTSLTGVVIPDSVTSIGPDAFAGALCDPGSILVMQNQTVPAIAEDAFDSQPAVYCPEAGKAAYKEAFGGDRVKGFALTVEKSQVNAYRGDTVTLKLDMTKPDGAVVVWTANNPDIADIASSGDQALTLHVKAAGDATFTGIMKAGDIPLKTITVDVTGALRPSSGGGGGSSSKPPAKPEPSTETKVDGGVKTEVTTTTTQNQDGSVTKEETKVVTTPEGTKTQEKTTSTVDAKTGTTATTTVKTDGAGKSTAQLVVENSKNASEVSVSADAVKTASKADEASMTIKTAGAEITLDADAMAAVAEAKGGKVTIAAEAVKPEALPNKARESLKDAKVVELSIKVDQNKVSSFNGGRVTVAVPYTKTDDSRAVAVYYVDDAFNLERVPGARYDQKTKSVVFATGHFSYYAVKEEAPLAFKDVKDSDWYYDAVRFVVEAGLFSGTSETAFSPDSAMTRGMLVTVLYQAAGKPDVEKEGDSRLYIDVNDQDYFSRAVYWARQSGIAAGTGENTFSPDDCITREQLAAMLYRYAGSPAVTGNLNAFQDSGAVSKYAYDALCWAVSQGIISGTGGGKLDPQGVATRAQVATVLMNYMTKEAAKL